MSILAEVNNIGDGNRAFLFRCPGCQSSHLVFVQRADDKPVWHWNGDLEKPTFTPSLRWALSARDSNSKEVCHSFVTDGRIHYLSDCTHALVGQTVDLPRWNRL